MKWLTADKITIIGFMLLIAGVAVAADERSLSPPQSPKPSFLLDPPKLLEILVTKLDENKARLLVRFEEQKDRLLPDSLTVPFDDRELSLKDRTTPDDSRKNYQVFSVDFDLDIRTVAAENQRLLDRLILEKERRFLRIFKGREVVSTTPVDELIVRLKEELERFSQNNSLGLHLFPFDLDLVASPPDPDKTLIIKDPGVIEDGSRTSVCKNGVLDGTDPGDPTKLKKWSFGYLMQQMANGVDPSDFALRWIQHWENDQIINGFTVKKRGSINWPTDVSGKLDLAKAPMKLLAIVNRIDLADSLVYGNGSGGEARFVFAVSDCDPTGQPAPKRFTVIVEYGVPHHTCTEIRNWAINWANLQNVPITRRPDGSLDYSQYNAALEAITDEFTRANAEASKPNGSALNQLRSNEIALGVKWELREFQIDPVTRLLREVEVKQTPDRDTFNNSGFSFQPKGSQAKALADWVMSNADAIKADKHTVPFILQSGAAFLGGRAPNDEGFFWDAQDGSGNTMIKDSTGMPDYELRHHFSLNTCNGCHAGETRDPSVSPEKANDLKFTHINPTPPFGVSNFLSEQPAGVDFVVRDPANRAVTHSFNEIARRQKEFSIFSNAKCISQLRHRPLRMTH